MIKYSSFFFLLAFLLSAAIFAPSALAANKSSIYIKVGDARLKKSLLALPPFQFYGSTSLAKNYKKTGIALFNTVLNDLDVSSYFQFIRQDAFLEDTSKIGLHPHPGDPKGFRFSNWTKIGAEFLIRAGFRIVKKELTLEAYLYHTSQAKKILSKEYKGRISDVRKIAHSFSNDIIKTLTGKKGIFLTKLVVASNRRGGKWREVYVMDWDGYNAKAVTKHRSVTVSPAWSHDARTIAYSAYALHNKGRAKIRNLDLFTYELFTGKRYLLSSRKGSNSGATFHPDGKHIYLTLSMKGTPDIYRLDLEGENPKRITRGPHKAMNVEPVISPDQKRLAFSSDRSGRPMIYVANVDGKKPRRITFAGRYNASPCWSPDSKRIVFAGWDKGHFDIFVMDADGTNMERLTTAVKRSGKYASNEDPSFSPDGRHVMFISDRTGTKQIYIVNIDGTNERRITTDRYMYYKAKWSPYTD